MENNKNQDIETLILPDTTESPSIQNAAQKQTNADTSQTPQNSQPASSDEQTGSHAWDILCLSILVVLVIVCTYLLIK